MDVFLDKLRSHFKTQNPALERKLGDYWALLEKWNAKVRLTSFALSRLEDEAIDRLVTEPLAAAPYFPETGVWIDAGSGGGSPAIPVKLMKPSLELRMVEARTRKVAFLREAIRALDLKRSSVEACRFEDLPRSGGSADIVSARAIRLDEPTIRVFHGLLKAGGTLAYFCTQDEANLPSSPLFEPPVRLPLLTTNSSCLVTLKKRSL